MQRQQAEGMVRDLVQAVEDCERRNTRANREDFKEKRAAVIDSLVREAPKPMLF
jgi:hypothetical protein